MPDNSEGQSVRAHISLLNDIKKFGYIKGQRVNNEHRYHYELGEFPIPQSVKEDTRGYKLLKGNYRDSLTEENYAIRQHMLIHYEDFVKEAEMRRFDLVDVELGRFEEFFVIQVPGLKYNRPKLVIGSRLMLKSSHTEKFLEGWVHQVCEREVRIMLNIKFHSHGLEGIRFKVHFMYSRLASRRLHRAIEELVQNNYMKLVKFPELVRKLTIETRTFFIQPNPEATRSILNDLNERQKQAVEYILKAQCRPSPYLLFGPPGTGKTKTLVAAVLCILKLRPDFKILICGSANSTVDLVTERIRESGLVSTKRMARIVAVHYRIDKEFKKFNITKLVDDVDEEMFRHYNVVLTTCNQADSLRVFLQRFDYVMIDEASVASDPETDIAISLMNTKDSCCVLLGDPHQLGPVRPLPQMDKLRESESFLSRIFDDKSYKRSLNLKAKKAEYNPKYITKLILNYRSDYRVMIISNRLFYDNELEFNGNINSGDLMQFFNASSPLIYHKVKGLERQHIGDTSWYNLEEAIVCRDYVEKLQREKKLTPDQIGVVTPYLRQKREITDLLNRKWISKCKVDSINTFQGQEKDVIIISTVRAWYPKKHQRIYKERYEFLYSDNRFNVAVTRAKFIVILIGDFDVLMLNRCWRLYLHYAYHIKTHL